MDKGILSNDQIASPINIVPSPGEKEKHDLTASQSFHQQGEKCLKQSAKVSARAKWCLQGTLFRHAAYGAPHPLHALGLPSMLYLLWCWITAKKTSQFFGCAPYSTYSVTYIVYNVEKIIVEWGDVLVTGVLPPPSIFLAKSNSGACYLPSCTSSW